MQPTLMLTNCMRRTGNQVKHVNAAQLSNPFSKY